MHRSRWWASGSARPRAPAPERRPRTREASVRQEPRDAFAQIGQQFLVEPWILLQPAGVAPRGVRQSNIARRIFAPRPYCFIHMRSRACAQVPGLGVTAHKQRKRKFGKRRKQPLAPGGRALPPRRAVVPLGVVTREAER